MNIMFFSAKIYYYNHVLAQIDNNTIVSGDQVFVFRSFFVSLSSLGVISLAVLPVSCVDEINLTRLDGCLYDKRQMFVWRMGVAPGSGHADRQ